MKREHMWMIIGLTTVGLGLAACAPARPEVLEGFSPLPAPARAVPAAPTLVGESPIMALPSELEAIVEQARRDLAARLGRAIAEIRLIEARAVTWPDSSLGCPEPGRMYLQVLTPGYRILLEVEGQRYAYHAGQQKPPFLCPADRAQAPVSETP